MNRAGDIEMVDVAPTLAVLLGTSLPASAQGRPLTEMLLLTAERQAALLADVETQQRALVQAYGEAIGVSVALPQGGIGVEQAQAALERARLTRLGQERVWRNLLALFLAFVPGYWLYRRREKKALWMLAGALVYLAVFNLRYLALDRNTYSLSWIPGLEEFVLYTAVTGGVSLFAGWLTAMSGLRAWHGTARQAAGSTLGFVWFVLYVLAIPILLNFAVNGALVTWTLPEFTTQYLGFFALVQALFVAVFGLLLVGVEQLFRVVLQIKR